MTEQLEKAVREYAVLDAAEKLAKKQKTPLNEQIKESMKQLKLKDFITGTIKAVFNTQERTSLNEERLLAKLNDLGRSDCIVMKPIPNVELIEDLIFKGELDGALLQDCIETKYVDTLTVKEVKPKNGKSKKF